MGSSFVAARALHAFPIAAGQAARYAVAAVLMVALARGRVMRPRGGELLRVAALAATGLVAFNWLIIVGVHASDPAAVGVVVGCVPVLLALLGPLQRGVAPDLRLVAAGVVVALGAALVQWTGAGVSLVGVTTALGALVCEAAFTLLAVPLLPRLGPMGITQWSCMLAVPQLVLLSLLTEGAGSWRVPTAHEALALGWMVFGVTAVAFMSWYGAVRAIGPERAGLFCGMLPVSAAVLGVAFGSVTVTGQRVAGALAVAAGITFGMLTMLRRAPGGSG